MNRHLLSMQTWNTSCKIQVQLHDLSWPNQTPCFPRDYNTLFGQVYIRITTETDTLYINKKRPKTVGNNTKRGGELVLLNQ